MKNTHDDEDSIRKLQEPECYASATTVLAAIQTLRQQPELLVKYPRSIESIDQTIRQCREIIEKYSSTTLYTILDEILNIGIRLESFDVKKLSAVFLSVYVRKDDHSFKKTQSALKRFFENKELAHITQTWDSASLFPDDELLQTTRAQLAARELIRLSTQSAHRDRDPLHAIVPHLAKIRNSKTITQINTELTHIYTTASGGMQMSDALTGWISYHNYYLKNGHSLQPAAWHHLWIGFISEEQAKHSASPFTKSDTALREYVTAAENIDSLSEADKEYLLGRIQVVSTALFVTTGDTSYRDIALQATVSIISKYRETPETSDMNIPPELANSIPTAETDGSQLHYRALSQVALKDISCQATIAVLEPISRQIPFKVVVVVNNIQANQIVDTENDLLIYISPDETTESLDAHSSVHMKEVDPGVYVEDFVTELTSGLVTLRFDFQINGFFTSSCSLAMPVQPGHSNSLLGVELNTAVIPVPNFEADCTVTARLERDIWVVTSKIRSDSEQGQRSHTARSRTTSDAPAYIDRALAEIGCEVDNFRGMQEIPENNLAIDTLKALAYELADALLNPNIRDTLSRLANLDTIAIQSNQLAIPWEILPTPHSAAWSPISISYALAIYPIGRQLPLHKNIRQAHIAVKGSDRQDFTNFDDQFADERDQVSASLSQKKVRVNQVRMARPQIIETLRGHETDLWYIATHGASSGERNIATAALQTDDEMGIRFIDLNSDSCAALGTGSPIVILNACNSHMSEASFSGRTDWATRFLDCGATAFIGTRWPVTEVAARMFAKAFFSGLTDDASLAGLMNTCRNIMRRDLPDGDPSWMAYTLVCNPSLTISLG